MEAGAFFRSFIPSHSKHPFRRLDPVFPRFVGASSPSSSSSQEGERRQYRGPKPRKDWAADWVPSNEGTVRSLPIYVGGASLLAVLLNRAVSGIAPVADASRSLVIIYDCICIMQIGIAAKSSTDNGGALSVDAAKLMQGTLYQGIKKSKAQNYLANLSLYPGKSELPFLPANTQAVILQPLGNKGIAVIGGDTVRGFTTSDQTWIAYIGEKLDVTLAKYIGDILVTQESVQ